MISTEMKLTVLQLWLESWMTKFDRDPLRGEDQSWVGWL